MNDHDDVLAGTWDIDPSHSTIGFASRHAMVTRVRGAFTDVSGEIYFDPGDEDKSRASVAIGMASIDTRNAQRDAHLRSADFFDVENYPTMTFESSRIEVVEEGGFVVNGELTIRGITRTLSFPLSFLGTHADQDGQLRAGFEGSRRIDRRRWEVSWNTPLDAGGVLVSERIQLEFDLSLLKRD